VSHCGGVKYFSQGD